MSQPPIVEVSGLRKVYRSRRRGETVAVDDVSFTLRPGEVVGLLGPNGAGKTTTIKCACTLVTPTSGEIRIDGIDVISQRRKALEKIAGVLEGNRNIYWRLTPRENLEFFAALQGIPTRKVRAEIDRLLERFGLADKRDTSARLLSKGMQQKLALACAMVKNTPVLMLDEPTLGLDVESSWELRTQIKEMAARGERTIMLSSHDMAVVQDTCDRVIIVNAGRIVTDDSVANLIELFRARAYTFRIDGVLDEVRAAGLRTSFPLIEITPDGDHTTIDVELPDGSGFYRLIDVLRDADAVIESIDRRDPNLEEIFLRILRGDAPAASHEIPERSP